MVKTRKPHLHVSTWVQLDWHGFLNPSNGACESLLLLDPLQCEDLGGLCPTPPRVRSWSPPRAAGTQPHHSSCSQCSGLVLSAKDARSVTCWL